MVMILIYKFILNTIESQSYLRGSRHKAWPDRTCSKGDFLSNSGKVEQAIAAVRASRGHQKAKPLGHSFGTRGVSFSVVYGSSLEF